MIYTLSDEKYVKALSADMAPVLRVPDGATVAVKTKDCYENTLRAENDPRGPYTGPAGGGPEGIPFPGYAAYGGTCGREAAVRTGGIYPRRFPEGSGTGFSCEGNEFCAGWFPYRGNRMFRLSVMSVSTFLRSYNGEGTACIPAKENNFPVCPDLCSGRQSRMLSAIQGGKTDGNGI